MNHATLQQGVAFLQCGQEQGTATIVAPRVALAARHSIIDHLENPQTPIELHLPTSTANILATPHPVAIPIEEDIVLLELDTAVADSDVIQLSASHLPVGTAWQAFGFPSSRNAGTWIDGVVATWIPQGERPQDVELSVTNFQALRSYRGYSGGPVWVAGKAVAILQRQLVGGLGSTSVLRLRRFLDVAGVGYQSAHGDRPIPQTLRALVVEARPNSRTYWAFENALRRHNEGYTVLTGQPGSGKTIFAAAFTASDSQTHIIGTYFAGGDGDPARLPPELHRDPGAFASWLSQETALVTGAGAPSRGTAGIREHAESVQRNLRALGDYFKERNQLGVLIVDDFCGLNGGTVDGSLSRVFPATPPEGLAIALTAASEPLVRTAAPHLTLASVVEATPLEQYDCERLVAGKLGASVQSTDIIRIASASNGNPLILSYLIREAQNALAVGAPLPDTHAAVPTAQAFYEQQWARLAGNDASMWLVAFAARLRGRMPEAELGSAIPAPVQLGLPTAWRTAGHLLRRDIDGIEVFHSSFRDFVVAETAALDSQVHDSLAEHCVAATTEYATANVVFHHLHGSSSKQAQAGERLTQEWFDIAAARFVPPAYLLSDVELLLRRALSDGSLEETIRLLLARSRLRFRYGAIFGKYAFELACVVGSLRSARTALRLIVHDGQLLCAPHEAVALIHRFVLEEHEDAAVEVYSALRRVCFSQYQTGEITLIACQLEALGLLLGTLGPDHFNEMKLLYRVLGKAVGEGNENAASFKTRASALPSAARLWRSGWFVHSLRYRESDPSVYTAELSSILEHAHTMSRAHGAPEIEPATPVPTDGFRVFTAEDAAAEIEMSCSAGRLPNDIAISAINILMRHGRDPLVVGRLAAALDAPPKAQVRAENGVDADKVALAALFRWSSIAAYTDDPSIRSRLRTDTREPWEQRFLEAASWLGSTYGRLCRKRRESDAVALALDSELLPLLSFTLAERSHWADSYALPEGVVPILMAFLCEILTEFAPEMAEDVSRWVRGRLPEQLGLYTEGCRASLWELAEGLRFCSTSAARSIWQGHLSHVLNCTANRDERVAALLACAQGAADLSDTALAEEALAHAIRASMGPSWYKEDQLALLVAALDAANNAALTNERWRDVAGLLEHASGDLTFQRFVRHEKESLVRHLSESGSFAECLALAKNYIWPNEQTQLDRIQSSRADKVTPIDGGRWGTMEIEPQAGALALLAGMSSAPALYSWAVIELFLPGDERYYSSFAKLVPPLFESEVSEQIKARLLRLLVADFAPRERVRLVQELRRVDSLSVNDWLRSLQGQHDWAADVAGGSVGPLPPQGTATETSEAPSDDFLFAPGLFGRTSGHRALKEAMAVADARLAGGDGSGAREKYAEGLAAAQASGWGIWQANSDCRAALRGLFSDRNALATSLRSIQMLILAEEYALDWQVAAALIATALPGLDGSSANHVVEQVFTHVRAMLSPELESGSAEYELRSLRNIPQPQNASQTILMMLLSSLDDACCHFRDRAATVVHWLLVTDPSFEVDLILEHVTGAVGHHSRELGLGIVHSWFVNHPAVVGPILQSRPAFALLRTDPSFAARYVASQVDGTPPMRTPPASGSSIGSAHESVSGDADRWQWRDDCREILHATGVPESLREAGQHLFSLTSAPSQSAGLWRIRRAAVASKDFWSSPLEREATLRAVNASDAEHTFALADGLMWNPQWPDATLDVKRGGVCEKIFEFVRYGLLEDCFVVDGQLLLHCREASFDERTQRASQLEITALLVPSAHFTGEFDRVLLHERRTTHGYTVPRHGTIATPVEPAIVKFYDKRGCVGGSMTPALPTQRLLDLTKVPLPDFYRASWRDGREWEPVGVGRPLRDGTFLGMSAQVSTRLTGMDLVWCLSRDGMRVALVDPARRKLFRGDGL